jgi:hypothetical protein
MNTTANCGNTKSMAVITAFITAFMRKHPIALIWMAGIICAGMVGCSDPAGPTEGGNVRPGIGSTYIYKVTSDTSGTPEVSYDTMVVSRTGLHIGGRMNVIEMRHDYDEAFGYSFLYLSYDPSGDVWMAIPNGSYLNEGDVTVWSMYPVGSRTSKELSVKDDSPYADFPTVNLKSDYVGSEGISVGNEKLTSHKISTFITFISSGGGSVSDKSFTWFAPTVGNIIRSESSDNKGERRELIAYSLKP